MGVKMKSQRNDSFIPARSIADDYETIRTRPHQPAPVYYPPDNGGYGSGYYIPLPQNNEGGERMRNKSDVTRVEFWIGITLSMLTIIGVGCGTAWAISSAINDRIGDSRQEITGNIQSSRVEITTRIDRLEDKMDSNFKETSMGLMKIQASLDVKQNSQK